MASRLTSKEQRQRAFQQAAEARRAVKREDRAIKRERRAISMAATKSSWLARPKPERYVIIGLGLLLFASLCGYFANYNSNPSFTVSYSLPGTRVLLDSFDLDCHGRHADSMSVPLDLALRWDQADADARCASEQTLRAHATENFTGGERLAGLVGAALLAAAAFAFLGERRHRQRPATS